MLVQLAAGSLLPDNALTARACCGRSQQRLRYLMWRGAGGVEAEADDEPSWFTQHGAALLSPGRDFVLTLHDAPLRDLPAEAQPAGGFDASLNKRPDKILLRGERPSPLADHPQHHADQGLPCEPQCCGGLRWVKISGSSRT